MDEQNIRAAIDRHWAASAAGDQAGEHEIYHDDVVCEYPQSGEIDDLWSPKSAGAA